MQPTVQGPARIDATGTVVPSGESAAHGLKNRPQPVLRALLDAGGSLPVAELVRRHESAPAIARASTSRTLRRLSRAGLVELFRQARQLHRRSPARLRDARRHHNCWIRGGLIVNEC
jgi:hypothetical protein